MRRTKEEAEITRQQLLQAALQVFSRKGYAATRLSDIAEVANVTRGAIYWHFGNKKELLLTLLKERIDPFFKIVLDALSSGLSPLEKIKRTMQDVIYQLKKDKNFQADEKLKFTLMHAAEGILEDFENVFFDDINRQIYLAEKTIEAGQAAGEFRTDISANQIALSLFAYIRGIATLLIESKTPRQIIANTDDLILIFLKGIQK